MKHIIALVTIGLAAWASVYMIGLDSEVHKMDSIARIIKSTAMEDSKLGGQTVKKPVVSQPVRTVQKKVDNSKEMDKKLAALKKRAGVEAFQVSPLYKTKCASCHGNVGQGIVGPKLRGRDKDYVLTNLRAFKAGTRKNYVMYGLLSKMSDQDLVDLATEIGTFQAKYDEANKK